MCLYTFQNAVQQNRQCEMHVMTKIILYTYVYVSLSAAVKKGAYLQIMKFM